MRIFDHQMDAFGRDAEEEYQRRLEAFVREVDPGPVDRGDLRALVAEARARKLRTEQQIAAYVVGARRYGTAFVVAADDIADMLGDRCVSPREKARALLDLHETCATAIEDEAS